MVLGIPVISVPVQDIYDSVRYRAAHHADRLFGNGCNAVWRADKDGAGGSSPTQPIQVTASVGQRPTSAICVEQGNLPRAVEVVTGAEGLAAFPAGQ